MKKFRLGKLDQPIITSWQPMEFHSHSDASEFLSDFAAEAGSMDTLRALLYDRTPTGSVSVNRDLEVIEQVAWLLVSREIKILAPPQQAGPRYWRVRQDRFDTPTPTKAKAKETADTKTSDAWIEIVLMDEDDVPVADENYWIKLTDGRIEEGKLDENGRAKFEEIPDGTCVVKFPDLDRSVWYAETIAAREVPPPQDAWIEIVLVGEDDNPIANEPYWIELPNGEIRKGKLPAAGKVRINNIPAGTCSVRFPNLDMDAWEAVTQG